jgi:hypothetical protein
MSRLFDGGDNALRQQSCHFRAPVMWKTYPRRARSNQTEGL